MEIQSIDTNSASVDSGDVALVSGDAAGATSNSGDVTLASGSATGTRGNVIISGNDINPTAVGDINLAAGDDIIGTGDVFDIGAMEMFHIATNAADPTGTAEGQMYYNSTSNVVKVWDGSAWQILATGGSFSRGEELITLSAGDITNQYIDLAQPALANSISVFVKGYPPAFPGAAEDYTVALTGGAGGVTRLSFVNEYATAGSAELTAGMKVLVRYEY
jgi:hypothetical protein